MIVHLHIDGKSIAAAAAVQQREVTFKEIDGTDGLLSIVYDVELCATGIEYPLSSGPATFTEDDLVEAVASQDDPAIQNPRVWLGHTDDDRFHAGRATPAGSAEPALGKVVNMRVEDQGQVLVGDIVGCPTWLAKILSSAYPNRSVEGFQEAKTVTGRTWGLVITDLALLGVTWPGVSTLNDLQALYSLEGPDVEVEETMGIAAARGLVGQVDVDDVRRAFYKELAGGNIDGLGPWSWIRAIQMDPNELIIDDEDSGEMFRLPFTPDEADGATFGEAQKVKIQYVNASGRRNPEFRSVLVGGLTVGREVAASWQSRAESRPESIYQEETMTPEQLRAAIGLPAEATDDEVRTKLAELNAMAEVPSPDQVDPPTPAAPVPNPPVPVPEPAPTVQPGSTINPDHPEAPSPDQQPTPEQVAAALTAAGMVAVPSEAWQGMQTTVGTLAADRETEAERVRARELDDAIRAGKVFPYQREYYAERLKDPNTQASFRHLLTASVAEGGLAPGLVPVTARGVDPGAVDLAAEAYPASWLPEVKAQAANGPITLEGAR